MWDSSPENEYTDVKFGYNGGVDRFDSVDNPNSDCLCGYIISRNDTIILTKQRTNTIQPAIVDRYVIYRWLPPDQVLRRDTIRRL